MEKNEKLKEERGISFKEIESFLLKDNSYIITKNTSKNHKNQKIIVIEINGYVWAIPFVENDTEIFLKTAYPSRKLNKLHHD